MTTLARATLATALALAAPALADDQAAADPMSAWSPPALKNEAKDRREIEAALKAMEAAGQKGDLDAAVRLVDFPVLMVTDDKKGEADGAAWSQEQWVTTMKPFYEKPMPADAMKMGKREILVVTDSLAFAVSSWTMKAGPKPVTGKSGMLLVRKGGQWKAKAFVEGGWGDAMPAGQPAAGSTPGK